VAARHPHARCGADRGPGVARAVGTAPASIYQHFADKAARVHALIEYDY
jgi:hypothetical protein